MDIVAVAPYWNVNTNIIFSVLAGKLVAVAPYWNVNRLVHLFL